MATAVVMDSNYGWLPDVFHAFEAMTRMDYPGGQLGERPEWPIRAGGRASSQPDGAAISNRSEGMGATDGF